MPQLSQTPRQYGLIYSRRSYHRFARCTTNHAKTIVSLTLLCGYMKQSCQLRSRDSREDTWTEQGEAVLVVLIVSVSLVLP